MRNSTDIARLPLVSTGWEPCTDFSADAAGSPVCADCGWLAREHDAELPLAS